MAAWISADLSLHGVRLHYYRTGGSKPAVVLAHGFSDNGLCWTPVAQALEAQYDVVMYDARGHGLSDLPEAGADGDVAPADLAGLVQSLGLDKPALMGHSMGAGTVAGAAAATPTWRAVWCSKTPAGAPKASFPRRRSERPGPSACARTCCGSRR